MCTASLLSDHMKFRLYSSQPALVGLKLPNRHPRTLSSLCLTGSATMSTASARFHPWSA